ncbi:MAG: HD domain-containing phosphohydrolase [Solirubrobacteraceae bacterium]
MTDHHDISVLVIDDDEQVRRMVGRILGHAGYQCALAGSAAEARHSLETADYQVLLCDVSMPGESGLELIATLRGRQPDTAVVMISGNDDPSQAAVALELGAYGYVVKPASANELVICVDNAVHRRSLGLRTREMAASLRDQVAVRTQQLADTLAELTTSRLEVIRRLTRAVEFRDSDTGGHIERVADLSAQLGWRCDFTPERTELIRAATPMHDVGKLGIADSILLKPGPLTSQERHEMQRHTLIGYEILAGSGIELLDLAAMIALTHHERWDGNGYPRRLGGTEIPLEGRIVAVADVFDALINDRVYRRAVSVKAALEIIKAGVGSQFDPALIPMLEEALAALD